MQHRAPAPITPRRAVGKTLVGIGVVVGKFLGPLAAIVAIITPGLMAIGVTSVTVMLLVPYGKDAPWLVLTLHEALSIRMPGALSFGVTLLLIAVAASALGLLSARLGNIISRSGNQVLPGTPQQKAGSISYGVGWVLQTSTYFTALCAIASLGLTMSVILLVMLFFNATGAELAPLSGIGPPFSSPDAAVKAGSQMLAGVIAFAAVFVAGALMTRLGKRLNPKLGDQGDDSAHRTLSGHEEVPDSSSASPTDQPNQ